MKVVHISISESGGGAANAACRLNDALSAAGVDSSLITRENTVRFDSFPTFFQWLFDRIIKRGYSRIRSRIISNYQVKGTWSDGDGFYRMLAIPQVINSDAVYLHWINQFFISIEEIGRLLDTGKPVIWFMHDMWPLTGGCHHAFECTRYQTHCGACPMLSSNGKKDLSYLVFERKLKCLMRRRNLIVVSPSHWLAHCAEKSRLFGGSRIEVIPNIIDCNHFQPVEKLSAKKALGLPPDKKIILFGCDAGSKNFYKGWNFLEEALLKLDLSQYELVVFGQKKDKAQKNALPVNIHYLGRFDNESPDLVLAYSAADVFVSPSIAENFSLTLCEASACGVPSVCFDIGGNSDIVLHKKTGYLAKYKDCDDLAAGIEWVLNHQDKDGLSAAARRHIESLCSIPVVIEKHKKLLQSLV